PREEAPLRRLAEAAADEVGGVVAQEGSGGGEGDERRQAHVSRCRQHSSGDDGRLARDGGEERVDVRENEDDHGRPPGARDLVDQLIEHGYERLFGWRSRLWTACASST